MKHQTWKIPAEHVRSGLTQSLADLWFTLVLLWEYLLGPFTHLAPLTEGANPAKPAVIIVPGFICRPRIYRRLQQAIHHAGFACHVLDLGYQVHNVLPKAALLSRYIAKIEKRGVYVIGHSMGGLILTTALHQGESRIAHGWTLGAPLWGTNIVWGVYAIGAFALLVNLTTEIGWDIVFAAVFLSSALRQMLPGSDLLRLLQAHYTAMPRVTSVFCQLDLIAFRNLMHEPGSATRFGRETDVLFPEAGHNNIAMGENAICAIVDALEAQWKGETPA